MFGSIELDPLFPLPRSHLLPEINGLLLKILIVNAQLFSHPLHLECLVLISKLLISSADKIVLLTSLSSYCLYSLSPIKATPYAPIKPAISGLTTSLPVIFSNALKTALFKNVPPWTTILSPKVFTSLIFITLVIAFLITEYDKPAKISPTGLPSFCVCLILEFINTVHLEPKSIGALDSVA